MQVPAASTRQHSDQYSNLLAVNKKVSPSPDTSLLSWIQLPAGDLSLLLSSHLEDALLSKVPPPAVQRQPVALCVVVTYQQHGVTLHRRLP